MQTWKRSSKNAPLSPRRRVRSRLNHILFLDFNDFLKEKQQYAEIANLLADPSRRAIYDTTKSVEYVNIAQTPGGTHHAPGMHKTVRALVGDDKLNKMRDIWSLKPKAKGKLLIYVISSILYFKMSITY